MQKVVHEKNMDLLGTMYIQIYKYIYIYTHLDFGGLKHQKRGQTGSGIHIYIYRAP